MIMSFLDEIRYATAGGLETRRKTEQTAVMKDLREAATEGRWEMSVEVDLLPETYEWLEKEGFRCSQVNGKSIISWRL